MIYYSDKAGVNFYREKKDLLFIGFLGVNGVCVGDAQNLNCEGERR